MSKVFVIPDIHLKPWILAGAEEYIDSGCYDAIVMLGDLVDDWDQQANLGLYEETLSAVINFIKRHDNVLYCYGNHDVSYIWQTLETGYSSAARETVLKGLDEIKKALPKENIAFIHRIDNVLFSHAGLTEVFVKNFFPNFEGSFNELLKQINESSWEKMWCDASPIWIRPQDGYHRLYPEGFLQVVGHTPVKETDYFAGLLTVDNFSTYQNGDPIGDQRFVWVDTEYQQWGFTDKGDVQESPKMSLLDIRNYKKGDWVLFKLKKRMSDEEEYHEGKVEIINRYPGGYASIDIMCKDVFFKHISLDCVVEKMTIGFSGDSCVLPPRWESTHGQIVEREET